MKLVGARAMHSTVFYNTVNHPSVPVSLVIDDVIKKHPGSF